MKTAPFNQKISPFLSLKDSSIQMAVDILRKGGLVAFPTETVYGLGARVFDSKAISKIFNVKGRPSDNPLIVHVADLKQFTLVVKKVPPVAEKLIKAFWPGPLTLILPRASKVPPQVSAGLFTLAVRMPNHPLALHLLQELGEPVAAPSANRSGRPSPTQANHVRNELGNEVKMVLDGGPCPVGLESTVLDITKGVPRILRPGQITLENLEAVIGKVLPYETSSEDSLVKSPGSKHSHYVPNVRIILIPEKEYTKECERWKRSGKKLGVLSRKKFDVPKEGFLFYRQCEGDDALYAQNLFSAFRDAEAKGVEVLLVEQVAKKGLGVAIMDRLERAAEGSK
ncbi:MAG TPA: L-threonylcarbamoyladenylate synthase [Nitrospiria bacterium]